MKVTAYGHRDPWAHSSLSRIKTATVVGNNNQAWVMRRMGFPGGSVVKNSPANAGDKGSIADPGRCPRKGNGNPLQYSCLGSPMDRGAWWAAVHGVAKSQT